MLLDIDNVTRTTYNPDDDVFREYNLNRWAEDNDGSDAPRDRVLGNDASSDRSQDGVVKRHYLMKPLLAGGIAAAIDILLGKSIDKRMMTSAGIVAGSLIIVDYFGETPDFDMNDLKNSIYKPAEVGALNAIGGLVVGNDDVVKTFSVGAVSVALSDVILQ